MHRLLLPSSRLAARPCALAQTQTNQKFSDEAPSARQNFEEFVQESIKADQQPSLFRRIFNRSKPQICHQLDANLKKLLDKAGAKLYYDCANNYPYLSLLKQFDLPDYMSSWYKLTLLHVWLCLMKLHLTLDAAAYQQIRHSILSALWFDIDKRMEILGALLNQHLNTKADMKKMHGLYIQTLLEYDEGFLDSDCMLASAIWRNMYISRAVDPVYLNNVVRYIRATVYYLDTLDTNNLIVEGLKSWEFEQKLEC